MISYYLAVESARKGFGEARRLAAESFDKYLLASGLPQKYGTQIGKDLFGRYRLYNYDSTTTDKERSDWDVPPLDSLKFLAAKLSPPTKSQR
jgi:hypothetical protein